MRTLCSSKSVQSTKDAGRWKRGLARMADKLLDAGGADPAQCWSLTLKVAQFSVAGSNDAQDVEKTMEMGNMCTTE